MELKAKSCSDNLCIICGIKLKKKTTKTHRCSKCRHLIPKSQEQRDKISKSLLGNIPWNKGMKKEDSSKIQKKLRRFMENNYDDIEFRLNAPVCSCGHVQEQLRTLSLEKNLDQYVVDVDGKLKRQNFVYEDNPKYIDGDETECPFIIKEVEMNDIHTDNKIVCFAICDGCNKKLIKYEIVTTHTGMMTTQQEQDI